MNRSRSKKKDRQSTKSRKSKSTKPKMVDRPQSPGSAPSIQEVDVQSVADQVEAACDPIELPKTEMQT